MSNKVLVIGAVNIDIFVNSDAPYTLEDSNLAKISLGFGGVGGNIATNCNTLGLDVSFLTVFSSDVLGNVLKSHYQNLNIDITHAKTSDTHNASMYLGIMDQNHDLFLGLNDMSLIQALDVNWITNNHNFIQEFDVIVLDNNLSVETLKHIVTAYQDKTIIIDAVSAKKVSKLKPFLSSLSILKVNQLELNELSSKSTVEAQIQEVLQQGLKSIIVTNKEQPVYYGTNHSIQKFIPVPVTKIVNATGAGDAFISAIAYGICKKMELEKYIDLAMDFAKATLQVETSTMRKGEYHVR